MMIRDYRYGWHEARSTFGNGKSGQNLVAIWLKSGKRAETFAQPPARPFEQIFEQPFEHFFE